MPWTERQRVMLRALGLRVDWHAEATDPAAPAEATRRGAADASAAPPAPGAMAATASPRAAPTDPPPASPSTTSRTTPPIAAPVTQIPALAGPRPSGLESMDWDALRAAVAACRACRLCDGRKQTVFGVGHPSAHWMVIGEAPGAQEDEQGEPFVGAAGQLLDAMLRALGLTRADEGDPALRVYIANTLKCRPPGNRNPQADELAQCEPFLLRQIELVQPRLILAMGRFAVQTLLRSSEPIGKLRGRVHGYQGVPLVVTYHPAYLLRNPTDKAKAWEDLCLAAEVAEQAVRAVQAGKAEPADPAA